MIGRIAIHDPGRRPIVATGTSKTLLAMLVAGGPDGVPLEVISHAYWSDSPPHAWRTSLRLSTAHLVSQLPDGWTVSEDAARLQLVPGRGFVDAWRVEAEFAQLGKLEPTSWWLSSGPPFPDIEGITSIDLAAARLTQMIGGHAPPAANSQPGASVARIQTDRRLIALGNGAQCSRAIQAAAADQATNCHLIIGDRRLLLPLGPIALAFPELRYVTHLEQGVVNPDATTTAFQVVTELLAMQATFQPQRVIIDNAHELDGPSLIVASMLIEHGSMDDFSLLVCADHTYRDLRWLDFMTRATAAGCGQLHLPLG